MTGLEGVLLAIVANLASEGLAGTARAAWSKLRTVLLRSSAGDARTDAWIQVFDVDPQPEAAVQIAMRLHELGRDDDPELREIVQHAGPLLGVGPGATAAWVGTNYGSIGGLDQSVHLYMGDERALQWEMRSPNVYAFVNNSDETVLVEGLTSEGVSRLVINARLPAYLGSGESIPFVVEVPFGSPRPTVRADVVARGQRRTVTKELSGVVASRRK